jgi:hypothetical protein
MDNFMNTFIRGRSSLGSHLELSAREPPPNRILCAIEDLGYGVESGVSSRSCTGPSS